MFTVSTVTANEFWMECYWLVDAQLLLVHMQVYVQSNMSTLGFYI
jgi:hypothetical protein